VSTPPWGVAKEPPRRFWLAPLACVLLPLPLSGIVRTLTSLSLERAALVALPAALAIAICWSRPRAYRGSGALFCAMLAMSLLLAGRTLMIAAFAHLPSIGGFDAPNHVRLARGFAAGDPHIYGGMNALYALVYWVGRIGHVDSFVCFALAFYAVVVTVACFVASAAAGCVDRPSGVVDGAATLAAFGAAAWIPATRIVLPLLHHFESYGFFTQVFGLTPLLLGLYAYAASATETGRICALVLGAVAIRYTYALGLEAFCLTAAAALALERGRARPLVVGLRLAAIASFVAAGAWGLRILARDLASRTGACVASEQPTLAFAVGAGALAILAGCADTGRTRRPAERMVQGAALFAFSGAAIQLTWWASGLPREYYFHKYGFAPAVVGALATVAWLTRALAGRFGVATHDGRRVGRTVCVGVSAVAATLVAGSALVSQRISFVERAHGRPPWRSLRPLADRATWRLIEAESARGAPFGAALLPGFTETMFANAHFGAADDPRRIAEAGLRIRPDQCVFYVRGLQGRNADSARWLDAHGARCVSYRPDAIAEERTLCVSCPTGSVRTIAASEPEAERWSGVWALEHAAGTAFRWSNGEATISVAQSKLPGGASCLLYVASEPQIEDARWDGVRLARLGQGFVLPAQRRADHVLTLRSSSAIPAMVDRRAADGRRLGARLYGVELVCLDFSPESRPHR
jgi:hypothetical protein